jgi:hypothetical protein
LNKRGFIMKNFFGAIFVILAVLTLVCGEVAAAVYGIITIYESLIADPISVGGIVWAFCVWFLRGFIVIIPAIILASMGLALLK